MNHHHHHVLYDLETEWSKLFKYLHGKKRLPMYRRAPDTTTISDVDDRADITLGVPVLSTTFSVNSYTILFLSLLYDLYILVLNRLP